HHRPGLTVGVGGVVDDVERTSGASANQLSRLNKARAPALKSPKVSRLTSWKTFPVTSGLAPSSMMNDRRTRSEVPFRMKTLWASRADAGRIGKAGAGFCVTSLAT